MKMQVEELKNFQIFLALMENMNCTLNTSGTFFFYSTSISGKLIPKLKLSHPVHPQNINSHSDFVDLWSMYFLWTNSSRYLVASYCRWLGLSISYPTCFNHPLATLDWQTILSSSLQTALEIGQNFPLPNVRLRLIFGKSSFGHSLSVDGQFEKITVPIITT